jgi:acyl carrier protein
MTQQTILTPELLQAQIANWCKAYLAQILERPEEEIDLTTSFERYGLDSSVVVGMTGNLGDWLGHKVDPGATFDHPSIEKLSRALATDEKLFAAVLHSRALGTTP